MMEVLYANIIKIVIFEPNKRGNGCFVQAQLYLGKRVMKDVLKVTKETDSLCMATKMQCKSGQAHLFKNPDNPIDQSGIISRDRSAQCYFQNRHYHHPMLSKCPV